MAGLQRVTAALADALDPAEVARIVVAEGAMALGARAALLARVTRGGRELEIVASEGFPADRVGAWRRIPIDAPVPLADAVRRATLIRLPSRAAAIEAYPALATALPHRDHYALVAVPVVAAGGTLGVLGASFSTSEVGDPEEDALLQTLARQCGQALQRAALYRAEQSRRAELEALLDAVEDAIVVYAPDGRIRRTNRRARERFQRRWGTLPGSIGEILALGAPLQPGDGPMASLAVEVALREGRVCDDVVDDRDGAGATRRYFEVAVPLRDEGGAVVGAIEVARDVTDLETAIEERARLDGAVKTIRLVAHELGNALTAVAAYGAILPEMVDGEASQIARDMANGAEEAGQLLQKLQRLARFQEMEFGGQVMLDVEASARPYDSAAADPPAGRGKMALRENEETADARLEAHDLRERARHRRPDAALGVPARHRGAGASRPPGRSGRARLLD
jgi:PAS domain-containing protein